MEGHRKFIGGEEILEEKYEAKLEFPGGTGGAKQKTFHGGSIHIFWNCTILQQTQFNPVDPIFVACKAINIHPIQLKLWNLAFHALYFITRKNKFRLKCIAIRILQYFDQDCSNFFYLLSTFTL